MLEPERILRLEDDAVVFLDQRRLPLEEVDVRCGTAAEVADAIRTMVVRGAPAIGVAAAYGMALAAANGEDLEAADRHCRQAGVEIVEPPNGLYMLIADPDGLQIEVWQADDQDAEPGAAADGGARFVSGTSSSPVPRRC